MKYLFTFCAALFMAQLAIAASDTNEKLVVRVKGMRCEECAHKVRTVLQKNEGIEAISFDLEKRTVSIEYDGQKTCADSIKARLDATGRYKSSPYSPDDVITRGMGLQMADMHCQNCADRIAKRLAELEGIDSIAPHVDKHYVFVRYDANKTSKAVIRESLGALGFTPVNYYTSKDISFAYFIVPEKQANDETIETALALDGVDDANVNTRQNSLAITYVNTDTSEEKLLQELKAAGIEAKVPAPHECDEKENGE